IVIEPAQVRLKPDAQDGYMWNALPERQHLFTKQLSKHSLGAYMELCREVGKSFEAVARDSSGASFSGDEIQASNSLDPSFSSTIYRLREDVRLTDELICAKDKARDDFVSLQQMEQRHAQSETNLRMALDEIDLLKEENVRFRSQVRRLSKEIESSEREAKKALSALHKWGRVARNHSKTRRVG
ncbi:hypothetical protein MMC29_004329, partial [Sticta canariensis]|nr:hypothetical protein [Sticta canariensis]